MSGSWSHPPSPPQLPPPAPCLQPCGACLSLSLPGTRSACLIHHSARDKSVTCSSAFTSTHPNQKRRQCRNWSSLILSSEDVGQVDTSSRTQEQIWLEKLLVLPCQVMKLGDLWGHRWLWVLSDFFPLYISPTQILADFLGKGSHS